MRGSGAGRPAAGTAGRVVTVAVTYPARTSSPEHPCFPREPSLPCVAAPPLSLCASSYFSSLPGPARGRCPRPRTPRAGASGPPSGHAAPNRTPPPPPPELKVERPGGKPLIREGQAGAPAARRHLVLPPGRHVRGRRRALVRAGRPRRLERRSRCRTTGTPPTRTLNKSTVGWYRKEFTLPLAASRRAARRASGRSASRARTTAPRSG